MDKKGKEFLLTHNDNIQNMEIEAKFLAPDLRIFERIKNLSNNKFEGYNIKFRYESLFIDQYYDTEGFNLFREDGLLRSRCRFKDNIGDVKRDIRFQAKDAAFKTGSVFFRNEVRGKKSNSNINWDDFIETQISENSQDKAVKFIQDYFGISPNLLTPVLEVRDIRYRLFLIKNDTPIFEISLDRGQIIGLVERKSSYFFYELEIENVSANTEENIYKLIDISNIFMSTFELNPSSESKYRQGIKGAVT